MRISSFLAPRGPARRASFALVIASLAPLSAHAQGEAIGIRDVSLSARGYVLYAQNIEIAGSTLPRAAIETAIRGGDPATLAGRLESMGAQSVTFTDMKLQQTAGGPGRTIAFGKLVLTGLNAGRIRSLQGTNGSWRSGANVESTIASLNASGVDAGVLLRLVGDTAAAKPDAEPLVTAATFERVESNPSAGMKLSIQKITLNDVRVTANAARSFPNALGAIEFSDIRLSLPPREANVAGTEARIQSVVIGADRLTSDDVPTRYRLSINNLSFPLSATDKTPYIQNLRALGLEELVLSGALEGNWSEKSRELKLDRLGVNAARLGGITFSGALADVAPEAFTETGAAARAYWDKAMVRTLGVVVRNEGLYERATDRYARATSRPVEEIRRQVGIQAAEAIRQLTGGAGDQVVANAMTRFLANPKSLTVSIAPKAGANLPLSAVLAKGGMQAIAGKYEVTAKAE